MTLNTEQVTALIAGVPTIITAVTALVVALKGKKNTQALANQTNNALQAHLVTMHTSDIRQANPTESQDIGSLANRYNPDTVSRARQLVEKMEGKKP